MVKLQGLRAHLFEAHDATHNANSSEIAMHLKMAGEEISSFLQNLTTGQLQESKNANLSNTLQLVKMQLSNTTSIPNTENMGGESDGQSKTGGRTTDASLPGLGYLKNDSSTNA